MSFGNRWGYTDDGQTANNQMALYDWGKGQVPLLFDNRGLPAKDMEWGKSQKDGRMPVYYVTGQGKGGPPRSATSSTAKAATSPNRRPTTTRAR